FVSSSHMPSSPLLSFLFFTNTTTPEIYTLSLHDALPIYFFFKHYKVLITYHGSDIFKRHERRLSLLASRFAAHNILVSSQMLKRSEEHTSELQSRENLVCRLLLEKKNEQERIKTSKNKQT